MKTKISAVLLAALTGLSSVTSAADPAATPTSAPAAPAATSPVITELQALIAKVKTKLNAGQKTEEALSAELKEFDALLAAHKTEKTDEVAQVLVMKAMLYAQVFENLDQAQVLLKQLKADFPETEAGKSVDKIIGMLDKQKESLQAKANLKPGGVFPDFKETDIAGKPLSLSNYKGKVVLVDFWATWCGPCVKELPNVIAAYKKYHDKGFEIVGISLDQDRASLDKFIKDNGMTWVQYFDGKGWESKLGQKYGISSIPSTYLLDGDGKIIATDLRGPALEEELAKRLAAK